MKSRMFPFVKTTINPVKCLCRYKCEYCWVRDLILKRLAKMNPDYARAAKGEIVTPDAERLRFQFRVVHDAHQDGPLVYFISDMCDLFGPWIGESLIDAIFQEINRHHPTAWFLFLTKNPGRYLELEAAPQGIPWNAWLGATIETNRSTRTISEAPEAIDRFAPMFNLRHPWKFLSIEPIMDFDLSIFTDLIQSLEGLQAVAIGYDNYCHHLPEPSLAKTETLIRNLEANNVKVFRKSIRKAWWESKDEEGPRGRAR